MKISILEGKNYVKKHYPLILLSVLTAVFCFGFNAFTDNIRIDTEELINSPGTTLGWLRIGRYGLVFLKRLLGLGTYNSVKSGTLFLLFFILNVNLLCYFFYQLNEKKDKYPYWIFVSLYATSCIWSYQFYFLLQQAEIALAMCLVVIVAYFNFRACFFTTRKSVKIVQLLFGMGLLVLCFGTYQALVVYYVAVCIAFFILYLQCRVQKGEIFPKEDCKKIIFGIGMLMTHFIVAFLINNGIARTWFTANTGYMEDQITWGTQPIVLSIYQTIKAIAHIILLNRPGYFSFYLVDIVLAIFILWALVKKNKLKRRFDHILLILAVAGLFITPFLMAIYMGATPANRTQFAMPLVAAFLGMYLIAGLLQQDKVEHAEENLKQSRRKQQRFILSLVCLTVAMQIIYNLQLTYTDEVRYKEDVQMTENMLASLEEISNGNLTEKPVIFVGHKPAQLGTGCIREEIFGWSFYEWDCTKEMPTGATTRIDGFIQASTGICLNNNYTEEMQQQAVNLSLGMPSYPTDGSVIEEDEFIIVKLSNIDELE